MNIKREKYNKHLQLVPRVRRSSWQTGVKGIVSTVGTRLKPRAVRICGFIFLFVVVLKKEKKKKKKRERSRIVDLWNRQQQVAGSLRYYTEIRMLKSELISAILLCKKKNPSSRTVLRGGHALSHHSGAPVLLKPLSAHPFVQSHRL